MNDSIDIIIVMVGKVSFWSTVPLQVGLDDDNRKPSLLSRTEVVGRF